MLRTVSCARFERGFVGCSAHWRGSRAQSDEQVRSSGVAGRDQDLRKRCKATGANGASSGRPSANFMTGMPRAGTPIRQLLTVP